MKAGYVRTLKVPEKRHFLTPLKQTTHGEKFHCTLSFLKAVCIFYKV